MTGSTTNVRSVACLALITATNLLVLTKYVPRLQLSPTIVGTAYLAAVAGGVWMSRRWAGRIPVRWRLIVLTCLVVLAVLVSVLALDRVPVGGLRVDRWSAITTFNERLLSGQFPYEARTHLGSRVSGLPTLFVVALPFQFAGDVGYLQPCVLAAFAVVIVFGWGRRFDPTWPLVLLLTSPAFLWEVLARSELVSNALLVVVFLVLCERWRGAVTGRRTTVIALFAGLCASTRLSLVVPMLVYFVGYFRGHWRAGMGMAAGAVLAFGTTLLPFALWDWPRFVANNPMAWQTSLSPASVQVAAVLAAGIAGLWADDLSEAAYLGGAVTFAAVAAAFAVAVSRFGLDHALRGSGFDISYFDLAVPFLLVPLLFARPEPVPVAEHSGIDQ